MAGGASVRCGACGADNPSTNRFCGSCGTPLVVACSVCGQPNAPTNRFCGQCGAALAGSPSEPSGQPAPASPESYTPRHLAEKIIASRSTLEGERKQVTVLFADLADSTELIRDVDPEKAQALLDGAISAMLEAVHRYEGTVNQILADGIMAPLG